MLIKIFKRMSKLDIKYISTEINDIIRLIFKKSYFNKHLFFYDYINPSKLDMIINGIIPIILDLSNGQHIKYNINSFNFHSNKRNIYISYKLYNNIIKFNIFIS